MLKFCITCGTPHRNRGIYCSADCEKELNNRKRAERAEKKCRLCGRAFRRPRVKQSQEKAVLTGHTTPEIQQPLGV